MARLEGAPVPMFLQDDWEKVVHSMPVFNGDGPVPAVAPEDPAAKATVNVSSGDSSEEEEEEEREGEPDSEATDGESRGLSPGAGPALSAYRRATTRMMTSGAAGACPRSRRRPGLGWSPSGLPWLQGDPQPCLLLPSLSRLIPAAGSRASSTAGGCSSSRAAMSKCSVLVLFLALSLRLDACISWLGWRLRRRN